MTLKHISSAFSILCAGGALVVCVAAAPALPALPALSSPQSVGGPVSGAKFPCPAECDNAMLYPHPTCCSGIGGSRTCVDQGC